MKASQQCRQAYSKASKMLGIINSSRLQEQISSAEIIQTTCSTPTGVLHCCVVASLQEGQRAIGKNPAQIYLLVTCYLLVDGLMKLQ